MHPPRFAQKMPESIEMHIPGRGETTVWDSGTPSTSSDAPTMFLLHGWNVDGILNFANALPQLQKHFRIVVVDLHGHGSGHRSKQTFSLEQCADDAVAVADQLDINHFIASGYSLGGATAQVLARRYPERVSGLVLAATSARFSQSRFEQSEFLALRGLSLAARLIPRSVQPRLFSPIIEVASRQYPAWVTEVVHSADPITLLEAGSALGRFNSQPWVGELCVPSAVLVTRRDGVVDPERQRNLAQLLRDGKVIEVDAGHNLPLANDSRFGDALTAAATHVATGSTLAPCSPSADSAAPLR